MFANPSTNPLYICGTNSHPITSNPCSNPAIKVVPLPTNGSKIRSPSFVAMLKQYAGISIGNIAGWDINEYLFLP